LNLEFYGEFPPPDDITLALYSIKNSYSSRKNSEMLQFIGATFFLDSKQFFQKTAD